MKKNFFKKLSFVMALAMIISVIAPAAGAFAATGLRLNATSKTLFLGESTKSFNFNPLGMSKGATQKWTSSKPSVATVNAKNGVVTAKATGSTTITATITNAKKTVTKKLTAKVTVGDNVKTLSVAAPADVDAAKLAVDTDYKLVTSYVTKGGSKKTSNTFAWSVDKEGATVDKNGVFKATEPGEYTVTVTANRYKNIKVADATIKVTVLNSIKEVKQTTANAFTVTFAGKVDSDLSATTAIVAQVINKTDVVTGAEKVKSVTLDSTGKVATITLHADFAAKATYKFTYGTLTGTFVAASKDAKDVAGLVFDDFNVVVGNSADLLDYIYAVNADGVKILSGSDLTAYLTVESTGDQSKGYVDVSGKLAYIYTSGNTIDVKATFTNYVYNEETKKYDVVTFSDSAIGTGVTSDINTATIQYAANNSTTAPTTISTAWTTPITVAANDGLFYIHARFKSTTDKATDPYTPATTQFKYVSSDPAKLTIAGNTFVPIAEGTVTVIVKNSDETKVLGSFDVRVTAKRVFAGATAAPYTVAVGNHATAYETKTIVISTTDNLGNAMGSGEVTATVNSTPVSAPASATLPSVTIPTPAVDAKGKVTVVVSAQSATPGFYQYKVTLTNTGNTVSKDVVIGVTVADSNTYNTVANYVAVFEDGSGVVATSADFADLHAQTDYKVAVYGINSSGYRVKELTASTDYTYDVTLNGVSKATTGTDLRVVSGTSLLQLASTGMYNVVVKSTGTPASGRAANAVLGTASLNVTDSYTKTIAVKSYYVAPDTLSTVLGNALDIRVTHGDQEVSVNFTGATVTGTTGTAAIATLSGSVAAGNLYIAKVTATVNIDGVNKEFTFDVNRSFAVK